MITRALSIRQPWVEMILSGQKRVEMREWKPHDKYRRPFLIHAARVLDWRSVRLFGFEDALQLPRGGVVGAARVVDVFELDKERWRSELVGHWVVRQRRTPQYGLLLDDVVRFPKLLGCGGGVGFFPAPDGIVTRAAQYLRELGWQSLLDLE